jgi:hypothetical protein
MRFLLPALSVFLVSSPAFAEEVPVEETYTPSTEVAPLKPAILPPPKPLVAAPVGVPTVAVPQPRPIFGKGMKTIGHAVTFPVRHPLHSVGKATFPARHPQLAMNNFSHWAATTPNGPGYSAMAKTGQTAGTVGIFGLYGWHR